LKASTASLTKILNKDDRVIGGANDVAMNENYELELRPAIKAILETTKKTNLILNAIPKRLNCNKNSLISCIGYLPHGDFSNRKFAHSIHAFKEKM